MSSGNREPADALRVLDFWFRELTPAQWFEGGRELDAQVRSRFGALLERARRGELDGWKASPRGRLALVLLLDQFSRHIHRGHADSYASDAVAQRLVREAIEQGEDKALNVAELQFLYMPLMHAEDAAVQAMSMEVFGRLQQYAAEVVRFAAEHRDQIARFGRFPHRNAALGRSSSDDEKAFLDAGGGSFG